MDLALIFGIVTGLSAIIFSIYGILSFRSVRRTLKEYTPFIDSIAALLRYEEDEKGNPMIDARLKGFAKAISTEMTSSLSHSVLGQISGVKRLEKGLEGAMAMDIADKEMPILGLIGDFMGVNTAKYIQKHPRAMLQIAQYIAPMFKGQFRGGGPNKPHPYRKGR